MPKVERVREMVDRINSICEVEVDGGVDAETAQLACAAGADVFVAGIVGLRQQRGSSSGDGPIAQQHYPAQARLAGESLF